MALRANSSKQTRWLDLVQRWQHSKLTVREFCQHHQVSEPSFYSWRRVLRERGLIDDSTRAVKPVTPAFVKLAAMSESATSAVEVVLGQRVLRVRSGFDADLLLKLMRLLEESAC
jgi:transposase-like protein